MDDSRALVRLIAQHFNADELRVLCHDLGIDPDEIPGSQKSLQVPELIAYIKRRNLTQALLSYVRRLRPRVFWPDELLFGDAAALNDYRRRIKARSARFPLIEPLRVHKTSETLDPTRIYVPLSVAQPGEHSRTNARLARRARLLAIDAVAQHQRLVLLGSPGSGKSTVVSMLAYCLAEAGLADDEPAQRAAVSALGRGWTCGPLLPVYVSLRQFALWLVQQKGALPEIGSEHFIWQFVAQRPEPDVADPAGAASSAVQCHAETSGALILCDGLDEVPLDDDDQRIARFVRECIQALPATMRVLVTCRQLDYQLKQRHLRDWPAVQLEPLSPTIQRKFVDRWYDELGTIRPIPPLRGNSAASLKRRLKEPELQQLARSPLLLWMMLQLHAYQGLLPQKRALLYEECVAFLVSEWRAESSAGEQAAPARLDDRQIIELLSLVAHTAHQAAVGRDDDGRGRLPRVGEVESGDDGHAPIDYDLLVGAAKRYFTFTLNMADDEALARALAFASDVSRDSNGLLQVHKYEGKTKMDCRFPHRTFQEYLAGCALNTSTLLLEGEQPESDGDFVTRALLLWDKIAHWHEPLLLAASQNIQRRQVAAVVTLVDKLQPRQFRARGVADVQRYRLAGELLGEIEWARCSRDEERVRLWQRTKQNLARAMVVRSATLLARADAALTLAGLAQEHQPGDERSGVCSLPPALCAEFDAGEYPVGDEHAVALLERFAIARYPVTVWQYRCFVDAHNDPRDVWWKALKPGQRDALIAPAMFAADERPADNQPAHAVSWFEAQAFCGWLTARGYSEGWLEREYEFRLPTEAEWDVAASYDARAKVRVAWRPPPGAIWQNVIEADIRRPAPVGLFPEGASPCGALDMAGNVWEWCCSAHNAAPAQWNVAIADFSREKASPALRGGSFQMPNSGSSWAVRDRLAPDRLFDDVGFRVVRVRRPA